jgi:asparagine synthase (glutamine-hydrolysing)
MCGIAGFWGKGNESVMRAMTEALHHRGPDFTGTFFDPKMALGLGHARLSILDLSAGAHQPFFSEDKRFVIIFNGEIYNFKSIRQDLMDRGYGPFQTQGDTEVILKAYQADGLAFLSKLNGMFAFAIFDYEGKELLLARDRMGKKPLYISQASGTLLFASELKAILQHPEFKSELNINALNHYLTLDYVPTPISIFEGVEKLEGGHYLQMDFKGNIKRGSFWEPNFIPLEISFEEAKEELDRLLAEATALRLVADVPVGIFLSGGLDSSAVAYYAQRQAANPIQTFSIGFNEKSYDERAYAQQVATQLGTEHHERILTAQESIDLIPTVFSSLDEPFADPSILPTYLLSQFTRSKVTVALGGDGSDELLAGYPTFISEKLAPLLAWMPAQMVQGLQKMVKFLPASDQNISLDFKLRQFLKGFESSNRFRHSQWLGSFSISEKKNLWNKDLAFKIPHQNTLRVVDEYAKRGSEQELIYMYLKTYLQDDILVKVDRASMMNSLEVRAPFMDVHVVNFLNRLPYEYKLKGFKGKYLLKETMRGKLPEDIIDRPKKGFGIPVSLWLKNELKDLCNDLLSKEAIESQGLFDYTYVEKLKQNHFKGRQNNRKELWNLMVFQLWRSNFLK